MKKVKAEIITIGNEILAGWTLNTNARWIAQQLSDIGLPVEWITTTSDTENEIKASLGRKIADMNLEPGPPKADRAGMIADINERVATLEAAEEALIIEASAVGQIIARRADISPAVVLEYSD